MKKLAVLVLAISLAACGYDIYQKPGATESQFAWDQAVCQNYALAQPVAALSEHQKAGGIGVWPEDQLNHVKQNRDFRSCMLGKGYRYKYTMSFRTVNEAHPS